MNSNGINAYDYAESFDMSGFRELPSELKPRERLNDLGPEALSDRELLAVLLNTGVHGKNVLAVAADLLEYLDRVKGIPSIKELCSITGMGKSKAGAIAAMLEFGRRKWGFTGTRIRRPDDIFAVVRHFADRRQERFICISMNGAHEVITTRVVTVGLVNRTIVHPREVYADPIIDRASAVAVAHNHPSGQMHPSSEDDDITTRLTQAADILGIYFLDHVIFAENTFFSYREAGKLPKL